MLEPRVVLSFVLCLATNSVGRSQDKSTYEIGVARVDITPDYPIRLNGFLVRKEESQGVRQRIWAKAFAIGSNPAETGILITVDNLGVPDQLAQSIARRVHAETGVPPENLSICASHTHTAPMIRGCAPNIFGEEIPFAEQQRIDRYTQEFMDHLSEVAIRAMSSRRLSTIETAVGKVEFAKNRRSKTGPVDHDLPVVLIRDGGGQVQAVFVNYACHCVTLSESLIGGDWAGYAQEHLERMFPGATAMVAIGCGADQNPIPGVLGNRFDVASDQGMQIASEVRRLMSAPMRNIRGKLVITAARIDLDLADLPARAEFAEKAKLDSPIGYHAAVQLAKLNRGEALRTKIDYPIRTWRFGDSLAMVFLAGEVVVDYSKQIKEVWDAQRLWINAYSNAAPCYIPSERVLQEGGYEGASAMIYYDQPTRFAPGLERKIIDAVGQQLGDEFKPRR